MKENKKEMNAAIEALLNELTLDEKIRMIHGAEFFKSGGCERLGIPGVVSSDGPCGVRNDFYPNKWYVKGTSADFVSYLPSNSAIASTWNRELAHDSGMTLGREARGRGKDVILAPGINIKRNPLCGRNFEYLSEDPYLVAEMVVPLIQGVQENDVSACVKHFLCNNQEWDRHGVNVELDERTLREIYLPGFEAAVTRAKSWSLMGSYNLIRKEHGSESSQFLTDILRKEWKYDGCVFSDWSANYDSKSSGMSGLDIEMGIFDNFDEYYMGLPLKKLVESGEVPVEEIDKKVRNIIRLLLRVRKIEIEIKQGKSGKLSAKAVPAEDRDPGYYAGRVMAQHALEVARESVVLLKNEKKRLPLKPSTAKKILVIGDDANRMHANGGGSAEIKALYEITPLLGLAREYGGNTQVDYVPGYYVPKKFREEANWQEKSITESFSADVERRDDKKRKAEAKKKVKAYREEAVKLAAEYDDVIIFGGLDHDFDVEGADRKDMKLPYEQDALISAVLDVNPNAIVVMIAGSPVDMSAWIDKAKALVWMSYNGMEGGTALAEVISGQICPSGKLTETWPVHYEDTPTAKLGDYPGKKLSAAEQKKIKGCRLTETYREGVFVGYRYYEKYNVPVQFAFGHGLSYVDFKYSAMEVKKSDKGISVSVKVTNSGVAAAKEAVQLYVGEKKVAEDNPVKELKGFDKIELLPGQTKTLKFELGDKDFSHFDIESASWKKMKGAMVISIGSASDDIRCKKEVTLK